MIKLYSFLLFIGGLTVLQAQEVVLPEDLRQHNLNTYNSSLANPVFSLNQNRSHSIAFWSRWQWQSIDGDPTSLFFNYSGVLNANSVIGTGFFQHNTGVFLHTGGVFNYAYGLNLSNTSQLSFGVNIFGYKTELSDDRFQQNTEVQLPQLEVTNDFVVQFAPGIMLTVNQFNIGVSSENLIDYNFSTKEAQTKGADKSYLGFVSYEIPLELFGTGEETYIKPSLYMKSIPNHDTQYGVNTVFSTSKFWTQIGYNNFYGIATGIGAKLFKSVSLGVLMEFATDSSLKDKGSSFEIITAYTFGRRNLEEMTVDVVQDELPVLDVVVKNKEDALEKEREKDSIAAIKRVKKADALAAAERLKKQNKNNVEASSKQKKDSRKSRRKRKKDSIAAIKVANALAIANTLKEQRKQDSIENVKEVRALTASRKLKEQIRLDSITKSKLDKKKSEALKTVEKPKRKGRKTKGHYEEVPNLEGVSPGYYLIANIYGTKKYFEIFVKALKANGLKPGSFYRKVNKYNYVYLKRYDTLEEIEKARDSKFNGMYSDKTWIFRVVGEK